MALFTDGLMSGLEDLAAQDAQISTVASVEGIDVTQKMALAQEELGLEIITLLNGSRRTRRFGGSSSWMRYPGLRRAKSCAACWSCANESGPMSPDQL